MPKQKRKNDSASPSSRNRAPVTTDSRFSLIHSDPRFALPKRKDVKVTLDSRFSKVFSDEQFSSKAAVDRYGRRQRRGEGRRELERFYHFDEEQEEENPEGEQSVKPRYDPARGEGVIDTSEESSSEDEDAEGPEVDEKLLQRSTAEPTDVPTGEVTRKLAVVNLDWDHVRAMDLMKAFSSFGKVTRVSVYPSEFGKERLEREEIEGPPRELFAGRQEDEDEDGEDVEKTLVKEDKGEEFDSVKLRAYQLERLRYYYAVVECFSEQESKRIYDSCDGAEYETTANFFDLRFIPDETTFDDKPRDECTEVPTEYTPNEFTTDALQHSKVKLTWDEDDAQRKQITKRAFSRKDVEDNELKAYLASSDSESDDDVEGKKEKYRALLGGLSLGSKTPEGDLEVTFTSGLGKRDGKVIADGEGASENLTTIEKYKAKEKARRQARKEKLQLAKEVVAAEKGEELPSKRQQSEKPPQATVDLGFDDPFFDEPEEANRRASKEEKKKKREENRKAAAESASKKAELELLMADDDLGPDGKKLVHFDMKQVIKAEKMKKLKNRAKKSAKRKIDEEALQDGFEMDVRDPRFRAVFESHEFAIDPTNPRFLKTEGMRKMVEERRKRGELKDVEDGGKRHKKRKAEKGDSVQSLVQSLKKKSKVVKG